MIKDKEIDAMEGCYALLKELGDEEQYRVLTWLAAKLVVAVVIRDQR